MSNVRISQETARGCRARKMPSQHQIFETMCPSRNLGQYLHYGQGKLTTRTTVAGRRSDKRVLYSYTPNLQEP